jgi:hypothetical protein
LSPVGVPLSFITGGSGVETRLGWLVSSASGADDQKRSVGAEIGRGSPGTKLDWPGARVYCYPPTPMGKLAFGMLFADVDGDRC